MKRRAPELLGLVLGLVVGVVGAFGQTPTITVSPQFLTFHAVAGGPAPSPQTLTVSASGGASFSAEAVTDSGGGWLTVTPLGIQPGPNVVLTVSARTVLTPGTYSGRIIFRNTLAQPPTLLVQLIVGASVAAPASVLLTGTAGQLGPVAEFVNLRPGVTANFTVSGVVTASGGNWLSVSPMAGTIVQSGAIAVVGNPEPLPAGTYSGSFVVMVDGIGTTVIPVTFVVNPPPALPTGLRFVPMEPCRLMETRPEYNFAGRTGAFGPPMLALDETRRLRPQDSTVCSVPAAAKAYSVNVTLLPGSSGSTVWVSPAGGLIKGVSWTIISEGQTVANTTIVAGGIGGAIDVTVFRAAHVLLDVNGYFTDENRADALAYYPMTPCRVVETRAAYRQPGGPFGPPSLAAGERRTFAFRASPCAVPASARAYAVSLTAVPEGPLAFLSLVPTGGPAPLVSSVNAFGGQVVSNQVIVPAGVNGSIDAFSYGKTDVIMDITGYFAPDDGQSGLLYYPVWQCRLQNAALGNEETVRLGVPGLACGEPSPLVKAYLLNVTALPNGQPMPFLTAFPAGQVRPGTSFLNAFEGQVATNSVMVPAGVNGRVDLFAYRATAVEVDLLGYFGR